MELAHLSKNDISRIAEKFIMEFRADVLEIPQPTPILEYLLEKQASGMLSLDFTSSLGMNSAGKKVLGRFITASRTICLDESLVDNDARRPFILAHEVGHYVLHSNLRSPVAEDTQEDIQLEFAEGDNRYWIEWQANQFAANILLPKKTLVMALVKFQHANGITHNVGKVYLDHSRCNIAAHAQTRAHLASIFRVAKVTVDYRMSSLGLLIGKPEKSTKVIAYEALDGLARQALSGIKRKGQDLRP